MIPRYVPHNHWDASAQRWRRPPFDLRPGAINVVRNDDELVLGWSRAPAPALPIVVPGTLLAFAALAIAWVLA